LEIHNLFKERIKIEDKNKEIIILDRKDEENELIACYKFEEIEDKDKLNILFKNENNEGNKIEIKLRIINKMKDMNGIIETKELKLSKWNTNNVTNISYLFSGCKSLLFLPDISKWNINNVKNISSLFFGCKSLSSLPDISKWNINKVKNISSLFSGCESLSSIPNISK